MLLLACAASCWIVGSCTAATSAPSLSARRDTDRASRSRAATTFGEGGYVWSMPSSVMTTIVVRATSPALRGSGGGRSGVRGSVIGTVGGGRREVAGPGRHGHEVGVILTSPTGGCSSAAESVVLDDGTVQVCRSTRSRI